MDRRFGLSGSGIGGRLGGWGRRGPDGLAGSSAWLFGLGFGGLGLFGGLGASLFGLNRDGGLVQLGFGLARLRALLGLACLGHVRFSSQSVSNLCSE